MDVLDWLPDDGQRMWTDVDATLLHAERRNMYAEVYGPDRHAGWDEDDEYREADR